MEQRLVAFTFPFFPPPSLLSEQLKTARSRECVWSVGYNRIKWRQDGWTGYLPSLCAAPPSVTVLTKIPSFSRPISAPAPIPMILIPRPSLSETHTQTETWCKYYRNTQLHLYEYDGIYNRHISIVAFFILRFVFSHSLTVTSADLRYEVKIKSMTHIYPYSILICQYWRFYAVLGAAVMDGCWFQSITSRITSC